MNPLLIASSAAAAVNGLQVLTASVAESTSLGETLSLTPFRFKKELQLHTLVGIYRLMISWMHMFSCGSWRAHLSRGTGVPGYWPRCWGA